MKYETHLKLNERDRQKEKTAPVRRTIQENSDNLKEPHDRVKSNNNYCLLKSEFIPISCKQPIRHFAEVIFV